MKRTSLKMNFSRFCLMKESKRSYHCAKSSNDPRPGILSEVAERAGVSLGRISQIQAKTEPGQVGETLAGLLRRYKLKPRYS
jgi:hypothetical protein